MRRWVVGALVVGCQCGGTGSPEATDGQTETDGSGGSGSGPSGSGPSTSAGTGTTAGAEVCDAVDNDGDGEIDEGCLCIDGQTQSCYVGPDGTQDVGACVAGAQVCSSGQWQTCEGQVMPADEESCNDIDDDCDGVVDEACVMWQRRSEESSVVYGLAYDDTGDLFVTGAYFGADFDLGGGPLPSFGDWEIFFARFAPDGSHLWSRGLGSIEEDVSRAIALDGEGGVYVTGAVRGDFEAGGQSVLGIGSGDLFVGHYSTDGTHRWTRLYGASGNEIGYDVAVVAGGPVVAGNFRGETDLGQGPVTALAEDDVFLLRLDGLGEPTWSVTAGSDNSQSDFGWTVAVDPATDDVLFGGSYRSSMNLGGNDLPPATRLDMFMARYDVDGNHLWSRAYGSGAEDDLYAMAIDSDGDIVIAGRASSGLDLGVTPVAGSGQAVVAKLDPDGDPIWYRLSQGGFSEDYATAMAVAVGPDDAIFAAGYFRGGMDFGDGVDTELRGREIETFIAKLDPAGAHLWSRSEGNDEVQDDDYGWAVAAGPAGEAAYGGAYNAFMGRMFVTVFGG